MNFNQLLILALTVEALWETSKMLWQEGKLSIDRLGALVIGVILTITANVDFFTMVDIPLTVPIISKVFTGILISRGSNALHDFISAITKLADTR